MSRFSKITDGCSITDIAENESGYNYYLYVRPGGSGIIMRNNVAGTTIRFYFFHGAKTRSERANNVQEQWDDRVNKNYMRPSNLKGN